LGKKYILSLLKFDVQDGVAMDVAPFYQTALVVISSGCLSPGFLNEMDPLLWVDS
jgi:hypothetical protein